MYVCMCRQERQGAKYESYFCLPARMVAFDILPRVLRNEEEEILKYEKGGKLSHKHLHKHRFRNSYMNVTFDINFGTLK